MLQDEAGDCSNDDETVVVVVTDSLEHITGLPATTAIS